MTSTIIGQLPGVRKDGGIIIYPRSRRGTRKSLAPGYSFFREDVMPTKEIGLQEKELETLRQEWAERRAERDLQSAIRLQNLKYWTMFTIAERTEYAPR